MPQTALVTTTKEGSVFPQLTASQVKDDYGRAREVYSQLGVDTGVALRRLDEVPLSLHCWQGDDIAGFETREGVTDGGGLLATGNYPGRARSASQLRQDYDQAILLIPGPVRVNLHAIYAETDGVAVPRTELAPKHFSRWIEWARAGGRALDFNPTFFSHPMAASGYTLSSADEAVRDFWIAHGIACRRIASAMGHATGSPCVTNFWIPDGAKDHPIDRWTPRERLRRSLDEIFAEDLSADTIRDAVEGKLFGLGSEDYVVGSHEFYLSYCIRTGKVFCMDMGHYHPTETIADKMSAVMSFVNEALIHVSRGIRWDSDHVVIDNDDLRALCHEVVRGNALDRIHFALDYFDASINRIGAWVIGARSFKRSLLAALLEPMDVLRELERDGRGAEKLGLLQELKSLPHARVWDYYCLDKGVPVGPAWLDEIERYEKTVLAKRK
jgi:L-rhamnose isomerase